jgi:hypothetical protein
MTASSWDDGERFVHLGNVTEFNEQFLAPSVGDDARERWRADCQHYANLAMFYSPQPAAAILPNHVDRAWIEVLVRQFDWEPVEVYSGIATHASLSQAVLDRPALLARIRSGRGPVLAWGLTSQFEALLAGTAELGPPSAALAATRHFESKAATHHLFALLAVGVSGIVVPAQRPVDSVRATVRALAARVAAGETAVLKAEHGVGGAGTAVITPQLVAAVGGARALVRQILPRDWFRRHGFLLVEQYVDGGGPLKDLTFDAVVADDGTVRTVGTGVMIIEGTRYRGVTVGPGVVPPGLDGTIRGFGEAVGRALAARGYRGWFDVDFVTDREGRAAPTEVNVRRTGPTVAFAIKARLDRVRGGTHAVRTLDRLPLGARLSEEALFDHVTRLGTRCAALGATLVTTVPTASFEPVPYVGVALAARSVTTLDAAENLVRRANTALARLVRHAAPAA